MDELKVGVLVPRSRQFMELGIQFISGIRDVFDRYLSKKYALFIEDVGVEAGKNIVMEKCQRLLLQYQTDIVIAFVGNQVACELSRYFDSLGKILIITNMGENHIVHPVSPFVFDHSMGISSACREMGLYLAQNGKKKILVTSSFYDSGYGLYGAFLEGVKQGGGEVIKLVFTGDVPNETELLSIEQFVKQTKADALYAIYCGNAAAHFLKYYFRNQYLKTFPLYGSPFLLPGKRENSQEYDYTIATPFCNDLVKQPFYIQGAEIADLLIKTIHDEGNLHFETEKIKERFESVKIESLRGIVELDRQQHLTTAPTYILHFSKGEHTTIQIPEVWSTEIIIEREGVLSGFVNPYLCL